MVDVTGAVNRPSRGRRGRAGIAPRQGASAITQLSQQVVRDGMGAARTATSLFALASGTSALASGVQAYENRKAAKELDEKNAELQRRAVRDGLTRPEVVNQAITNADPALLGMTEEELRSDAYFQTVKRVQGSRLGID